MERNNPSRVQSAMDYFTVSRNDKDNLRGFGHIQKIAGADGIQDATDFAISTAQGLMLGILRPVELPGDGRRDDRSNSNQ